MKNLDVVLSTREISRLIKELKDLKKEGRWQKGYHIHLWNDGAEGSSRSQVTLCHEKSYEPEISSAVIELG